MSSDGTGMLVSVSLRRSRFYRLATGCVVCDGVNRRNNSQDWSRADMRHGA